MRNWDLYNTHPTPWELLIAPPNAEELRAFVEKELQSLEREIQRWEARAQVADVSADDMYLDPTDQPAAGWIARAILRDDYIRRQIWLQILEQVLPSAQEAA